MCKNFIETEITTFNSRYEVYGVFKDKYEKIKEEIDDIGDGILVDYWKLCRESKNSDSEEAKKLLEALEAAIDCSHQGLIKLGAMVKKAKNLEL
jgi:hypothetical protein